MTIDTKQLRERHGRSKYVCPCHCGDLFNDTEKFMWHLGTHGTTGLAQAICDYQILIPALLDELDRLRELVGGAAATLTWASGAFQSDEESEAWTKLASPVLKRLLAALQEGQQ